VQRQAIVRMIESGPIPAIHGVVRWRLGSGIRTADGATAIAWKVSRRSRADGGC
jgi:hypothetical protein